MIAGAAAGACFGFLWWNTSPARIFMGDTGALGARRPDRRPRLRHPDRAAAAAARHAVHDHHDDLWSSRSARSSYRQAGVPDGAAAAPLRAGRLERGQHRGPLLDHRRASASRRASACSTATSSPPSADRPRPGAGAGRRAGAGPSGRLGRHAASHAAWRAPVQAMMGGWRRDGATVPMAGTAAVMVAVGRHRCRTSRPRARRPARRRAAGRVPAAGWPRCGACWPARSPPTTCWSPAPGCC